MCVNLGLDNAYTYPSDNFKKLLEFILIIF